MAREIPETVTVDRHDLAALVNYCFASEERDYVREGEPEGHIFSHIERLQAALTDYLS